MHPTLNSDWMEAVLGEELPREAKIAPLPQPHQPIFPPPPALPPQWKHGILTPRLPVKSLNLIS